MKPAAWLVIATAAFAQDARVERGERLFQTNCSIPYCHGSNGTAGRAPKLVGHGFSVPKVTNMVSNGIANTGMPSFVGKLTPDDLDAVVAYVMTLRGSGSPMTPERVVADSPGKALFFDAIRMGGCGRCHELEKRGSPVARDLKDIPGDLRAVDDSETVTVAAAGEAAFPGIVVEKSEKRIRVYDLSSKLPVLRTFADGAVKVTPGSTWKHRDAMVGYSDAELAEIGKYLRSVAGK